jgi:hypothetical protein
VSKKVSRIFVTICSPDPVKCCPVLRFTERLKKGTENLCNEFIKNQVSKKVSKRLFYEKEKHGRICNQHQIK